MSEHAERHGVQQKGVQVHGGATPEEVAAVLAVLAAAGRRRVLTSTYEHWRRSRLRAIRLTAGW